MHLNTRGFVTTFFAEQVDFDKLPELLEELLTFLSVDFVRYDDCQSDCIAVVIQDLEVRFHLCLTVGEALNSIRILNNLCLETGLSARVHSLQHNDIPFAHNACVVNRHLSLFIFVYFFIYYYN